MGKRKYGMPYQGSKSAIAENIIEALPAATHLYDVMGGGRCNNTLCCIKR